MLDIFLIWKDFLTNSIKFGYYEICFTHLSLQYNTICDRGSFSLDIVMDISHNIHNASCNMWNFFLKRSDFNILYYPWTEASSTCICKTVRQIFNEYALFLPNGSKKLYGTSNEFANPPREGANILKRLLTKNLRPSYHRMTSK